MDQTKKHLIALRGLTVLQFGPEAQSLALRLAALMRPRASGASAERMWHYLRTLDVHVSATGGIVVLVRP